MKQTFTLAMFLITFVAVSSATTCVWGKRFETHKVCGVVRDVYGGELAGATVRAEKLQSKEVVAGAQTSADGFFTLSGLAAGDYVIRVKSEGLVEASQSFRLVHPDKGKGLSSAVQSGDGCGRALQWLGERVEAVTAQVTEIAMTNNLHA